MKIIIDTNAYIWWTLEPTRLSSHAKALFDDVDNKLCLSTASVWEMTIKIQIGKLHFDEPLQTIIAEQQQQNNIQILAISLDHIWAIESLPMHHRDPFDRLIIAQASVENMPIITSDKAFQNYPVNVEW